MNDKIILRNTQKFDIGIVTPEKPLGVNIRPGSFAQVTHDELIHILSVSTLIQSGMLTVDEKDKEALTDLGIDPETDQHFIKDEDIKKKLGGTAKKLREWLAGIDEGYILDRVYDIAMSMNLSMDKIKALKEYMPNRDFIDD